VSPPIPRRMPPPLINFKLDVLGERSVRASIDFVEQWASDDNLDALCTENVSMEEYSGAGAEIEQSLDELKEVITTRATELWRTAQGWLRARHSMIKESYDIKKQHALQFKDETVARVGSKVNAASRGLAGVTNDALQLKVATATRASTMVTTLKHGSASRGLADVTNQLATRSKSLAPAAQKANAALDAALDAAVSATTSVAGKAQQTAFVRTVSDGAGLVATKVGDWAAPVVEQVRDFASIQRF